ncbi:YdeI/OmpD-associated family protein [Nocardioides pakistanensis]
MDSHDAAIYFESPLHWRSWLEEHHQTATEVWVGYWKKHTGRVNLTWSEAVDQALCFGWIDSVRKSVDADRSRQRFTPRKPRSNWSSINIAKVAELREQGLMTPAGLAAFEARLDERSGIYTYENGEVELSEEYAAQLAAVPEALAFFESQAPSYRKLAKSWVMSAKQEATRERRIAALVADSAQGLRVKPFRPASNG